MAHGRRRRGGHGGKEEASDERWLLTYADMITLLMALFMVLFSISSVNISKYQVLQKSLRAAFSGNILPGGKSIAQQGATNNAAHAPSTQDATAVVPMTALGSRLEATSGSSRASSPQSASSSLATGSTTGAAQSVSQAAAAQQEANVFAHIKQQLDAYAAAHGFSSSVRTSIQSQGLVIRVLTDQLLFDSGQASLQAPALPLLAEISKLLNVDEVHPVDVEGNTDNVPIATSAYPSNWELSSARAGAVLRFLAAHGVAESRMTAVGYADQRPIAANLSAAGRRRNRRVDIVLRRLYGNEGEQH